MTLYLDGETLTIEDIKSFLQQQSKIEIIDDALERVKKSRAVVERIIENEGNGLRYHYRFWVI